MAIVVKKLLQTGMAVVTGGLMMCAGARALAAPGQSFADAKKHWAYQPITNPVPPKVRAQKRVQSPIDAFLLARLEAKNLTIQQRRHCYQYA